MQQRPVAVLATACLALASLTSPTRADAQQAPPATLTIQVGSAVHPVSPTLYGLMTEEINYSYDGGLYAELVRNRIFQEHGFGGIAHWYLEHRGDSEAVMQIDQTTGPSTSIPESLRLDVTRADAASPAGVRNEGYWGIAARPSTTYKGSFYAKADSADVGAVTAALVSDNTGKALATATSTPLTTAWTRFDFTFTTGASVATSTETQLLLTVAHPGKVWLSLVSLFPPTYHDRANGNRIDLMEKLAAMHPSFLRLPGGNYLEGDEVDERFDWKSTIGPLVDRPGHRSPWNYQSTDGLGLLEFLEWCEDLKIQPVLAVYAGYSLKGHHIPPGTALQPFVNEALDELEFTAGDTSTRWGAVRAKLGHPAPFPLRYVEIGNEDWFDKSGSYEGRYAQFYKAIKARYPQYQLIATAPLKQMKPDVLDDHYYKRADEFFDDVHHYDNADRNGPKIFVGEWATREGGPTTNMGAALGDAAWMTGMERNSDLILLASYAPLLVNVNPGGMQWESDLIGYTALESYGSPSYYAQAIFAASLGTDVPASTVSGGGQRFFYSATEDPAKGMLYLKLVNASSAPQPVSINLSGGGSIGREATLTTLAGSSTAETNTAANPTRIVPVRTPLKGTGATFSHTIPPYAIQVLEIPAK